MNHLRNQWRMASGWRDLSKHDLWNDAPAVVMVDKSGRQNTYEVYIDGKQVSREWKLSDAKVRAERELGVCNWKRMKPEKVNALHYYFGWTTEFTTPVTVYLGTPA